MPVLVVASWVPSVDESTRGRFLAEQFMALAAGAGVVPQVVSFDTSIPSGKDRDAGVQGKAGGRSGAQAVARAVRVLSGEAMHGPPAVEVSRIPVSAAPRGVATDEPRRRRQVALRSVEPRLTPPTVIHAHTGFPDGAASIELARSRGTPLV